MMENIPKMLQNARAAVYAGDIEQATNAINALSKVSFPLQVADGWLKELAYLNCHIYWYEKELEKCIQEATIFFALTKKHIETPIDYYSICYIRAKAYFTTGEFRKALEDFDLALQISNSQDLALQILDSQEGIGNREDVEIHDDDGSPYLQLEKFDVSLQILDSQERIGNREDAEINSYRGRSYLELEDFQKAIEAFINVLDQNPDDVMTLSLLATAYAKNGNYQVAIDTFSKAGDINTEDSCLWYNRGCAYFEIGNYRDAERDFDKAIGLNNAEHRYYYNRSVVRWKLGKKDSAKDDWFLSHYLLGSDPSTVPEPKFGDNLI